MSATCRTLLAALVLVTACSGDATDPDTAPDATAPVSSAPATTGPSTTGGPASTTTSPTSSTSSTSPSTSTSVSAGTSTTASASTTTDATTPATTVPSCGTFSTTPVSVNYPMTLSGLVGTDIRTGRHDCFDRVVVELGGTGELPGYRVEYVDDPVRLSPSDLEVEIAGDATLVLSAGSWMTTMEGDGYDGPDQIVPDGLTAIVELRLVENFEGMFAWAIGVDHSRPFRVSTLPDPPRIVVDIAT